MLGAKYNLFFVTFLFILTCTFGYFGNILDDDCFCQVSQVSMKTTIKHVYLSSMVKLTIVRVMWIQ